MPEPEPAPEEKPDPSESTLDVVREMTGLDPEEELLGDPQLRDEYRKLKESAARREKIK